MVSEAEVLGPDHALLLSTWSPHGGRTLPQLSFPRAPRPPPGTPSPAQLSGRSLTSHPRTGLDTPPCSSIVLSFPQFNSPSFSMNDLGQVCQPHCVSVSSSVKWG